MLCALGRFPFDRMRGIIMQVFLQVVAFFFVFVFFVQTDVSGRPVLTVFYLSWFIELVFEI